MTPFSRWVKTFSMLWRRRRTSSGPRKVPARYDESVLFGGTENGRASAGNDEILALENQVLDLEIALTDASADHERTARRMIRLSVQLDVARKRRDAALAERRGG